MRSTRNILLCFAKREPFQYPSFMLSVWIRNLNTKGDVATLFAFRMYHPNLNRVPISDASIVKVVSHIDRLTHCVQQPLARVSEMSSACTVTHPYNVWFRRGRPRSSGCVARQEHKQYPRHARQAPASTMWLFDPPQRIRAIRQTTETTSRPCP